MRARTAVPDQWHARQEQVREMPGPTQTWPGRNGRRSSTRFRVVHAYRAGRDSTARSVRRPPCSIACVLRRRPRCGRPRPGTGPRPQAQTGTLRGAQAQPEIVIVSAPHRSSMPPTARSLSARTMDVLKLTKLSISNSFQITPECRRRTGLGQVRPEPSILSVSPYRTSTSGWASRYALGLQACEAASDRRNPGTQCRSPCAWGCRDSGPPPDHGSPA